MSDKKLKFSKKIVISVILLNVIFTIFVLYAFLQTGSEPSSLIVAVFGFTTVEMWNLKDIKVKEKDGEINGVDSE